jgi:chemotaxis-related protein WspD
VNAQRASAEHCWTRIGVQGDRSCSELVTHIHCRNCSVYSAGARKLLDAPLPADQLQEWTAHFAAAATRKSSEETHSILVFRCGTEWLALPTVLCAEVLDSAVIHSLPHRRSAAVLGLVNVRGELIVCVSLGGLLGIEAAGAAPRSRLLVVSSEPAPTAFQVDEVYGTHRFGSKDVEGLPATLASASARRTRSVVRWREHTVGLLDEKALLDSLAEVLA